MIIVVMIIIILALTSIIVLSQYFYPVLPALLTSVLHSTVETMSDATPIEHTVFWHHGLYYSSAIEFSIFDDNVLYDRYYTGAMILSHERNLSNDASGDV